MTKTKKLHYLHGLVSVLLVFMATGLPLYLVAKNAFADNPSLKITEPDRAAIATIAADSRTKNSGDPQTCPTPVAISIQAPSADTNDTAMSSLTSFYQTVIGMLLALLAIVAGLAYWTVRLVSESKAEEVALSAVRRIVKDSKEFNDMLGELIGDATEVGLAEMREKIESQDGKIASLTADVSTDESVSETTIVVGER